ncbi:hypothetical protein P692DRAFT_20747747, partial [Suillus brevipes Sb2]
AFIKLTANFPKRLTGLLMTLHSQHIPLSRCRDSFLSRLVETVCYLFYVRIFGAYIRNTILHLLPL